MKLRLFQYLLCLPLVVLTSCSCKKNPQDIPVPEPEKGGFVRFADNLSMHSKTLERNVPFAVLLPEDYLEDKEKEYPVVYMLHGYGDNPSSWNDKWLRIAETVKDLEKHGLEPMIYIFPSGYKSYYVNRFNGGFDYMDMFVKEFVPYIDATYRTLADKGHRAITGYSMGGFGAMVLAMKNPGLFAVSAPLSMSFRTDGQYMAEPGDGWNMQWGSIFGGEGSSGENRLTDYYKSHSPFYQFNEANKDRLSEVKWFLHCGDDEEQLLIACDSLHCSMLDHGYRHEFRVSDGGHTGSYWREALREVLPYMQFVFAGGQEWTECPFEPSPSAVELDNAGVYVSQPGKTPALAVYLAFNGDGDFDFTDERLADCISILRRDAPAKPFAILPCDLSVKSLSEWIAGYETDYGVGGARERRILAAIGQAGEQAMLNSSEFSLICLDNASLKGLWGKADANARYCISASDSGPYFHDAYNLYLHCKTNGIGFQYRVRNGASDSASELMQGMEQIRLFINY